MVCQQACRPCANQARQDASEAIPITAALDRALHVDPGQRFSTAREFADALVAPTDSPWTRDFKIAGAVSYVYRSQYREGVAKVVLVIPAK